MQSTEERGADLPTQSLSIPQAPLPPATMSSPAPLLRPPVHGPRSMTRPPRLGLSIPSSPNVRPVVNGSTSNADVPTLQRPAPPQLRLATPLGTSHTPQETKPRAGPRLPPLHTGTGLSAASSEASAHSRSGSFGDSVQGNGSGSAASSYSGLIFPKPQPSDPISAISASGASDAGKEGGEVIPDLDEMAKTKGGPLDVEDLDDACWKQASAKHMIEELGSLGEGAGGAVSRCRLKDGKTVFALKVIFLTSLSSVYCRC
jgi:mitogen-activated protein kinase kinase